MQLSFISSNKLVLRLKKRLKETSSKAKTSHKPFKEGETIKNLQIPTIADLYNYNISAINKFNYLTAQNASLQLIKRGGH